MGRQTARFLEVLGPISPSLKDSVDSKVAVAVITVSGVAVCVRPGGCTCLSAVPTCGLAECCNMHTGPVEMHLG
jgi:hypothetical protein